MNKILFIALILGLSIYGQDATGRSEKFKFDPKKTNKEKVEPLPQPKKEQVLIPLLKATLKIDDPSGNNIIDANEEVTIQISVKNTGGKTATDCRPQVKTLENNPHLVISHPNVLGDILPGDSVSFLISLKGDREIKTGTGKFNIKILERDGFDLDPELLVQLKTREYQPPLLQLAGYEVVDSDLDGKVEKNENCILKVRIKNTGENTAEKVKCRFDKGEAVMSFDLTNETVLGDIPYGQSKDVQFSFTTNNRVGDEISITLVIEEKTGKYGFVKSIIIPMDKFQKGYEEVIIAGKENEKVTETDDKLPSLGLELNKDIPKTNTVKDNAYAVIIGNKNYQKVANVEFAQNDAKVLRNYLITRLGFVESNIKFVADATVADLRHYFGNESTHEGWLFNNIPPNSNAEVFIYYSGHGAPDPNSKQGYIVPVDCDPNAVKLNGYSLKTFFDNLNQTAIDKQLKSITVVMDACFSGNSENGLILKDISPIEITVTSNTLTFPNSSVFSSSKSDQVSNWYNEKNQGLFTYFFLKGLRGDADVNLDGRITTQELFDYVSSEKSGVPFWARKLKGRLQNPTFSGKDLILVGE
ncbi:hypothetical protein MASR2M39_25230 [Ignavibacteriales bacterium]